VVEPASAVRSAERRRAVVRAPLESMGMRSLVVVAGDQNEAKMIDRVLAAVARLPEGVHLALVGRRIEGYGLDAVVAASGLGGRVSVHTDVSDEDFLAWLCAADVAVDLRFPHRGEVSGSLARAMQCGRATIVSGTGTYLDVPGDRVVHVSPGLVEPEELTAAIARLLEHDDLRARIGEAARAHMDELARSDATAHAYAEAIEGTLALVQDPSRRALARWAGALVDLGLTEADLEQGYGVGYAHAMAEFVEVGSPSGETLRGTSDTG
jgi:glycosyltransferase involved in cell wall biosynthesis